MKRSDYYIIAAFICLSNTHPIFAAITAIILLMLALQHEKDSDA